MADPKLNILIGAKLADSVQTQLEEQIKSIQSKLTTLDIKINPEVLSVLDKFASSFAEIGDLLKQQQSGFNQFGDSATKAGQDAQQSMDNITQSVKKVNQALDDAIGKMRIVNSEGGQTKTYSIRNTYGNYTHYKSMTGLNGEFMPPTEMYTEINAEGQRQAQRQIDQFVTDAQSKLNTLKGTTLFSQEQIDNIQKIVNQLKEAGFKTETWKSDLSSANAELKSLYSTYDEYMNKFAPAQQATIQNILDTKNQIGSNYLSPNNPYLQRISELYNQVATVDPTSSNWSKTFSSANKELTSMVSNMNRVNSDWQSAIDDEQKYELTMQKINSDIQSLRDNAKYISPEMINAVEAKANTLNAGSSPYDVKMIQSNIAEIKNLDSALSSSIKEQVTSRTNMIETLWKQNVITNTQAVSQMKGLWDEFFTWFTNKSNSTFSKNFINKTAQMEKPPNSSGGEQSIHRYAFSPMDITKSLVGFQVYHAAESLTQGFVQIQQSAAGLEQVFGKQITSQQELNQVSQQFISIAERYGQSITDVMNAGKLWGRQYKDLNTAITLTNSSTLLSVVDNLSVADANKAVESSMNALQMSVKNAGQAYAASMKLVDSWSAVSHSASVSAQDLTQGFERSAAAARVAGLTVDQLNALVAAGVRNTGRSGSVIGNMWKSVLANITSESPKVIEAFKGLGINIMETGKDGQQKLKNVWQIILQLSQVVQNATPEMDKYLKSISGGKYQYDSLIAALTNTKTLNDALNESLNSTGSASHLAQAQMHTLGAELQRLQDTIQRMAFNSATIGAGQMFKDIIVGANDFLIGIQKMPPAIGDVTVAIGGLYVAWKMFVSLRNATEQFVENFGKLKQGITNAVDYVKNRPVQKSNQTSKSMAVDLQESQSLKAEAEAQRELTAAREADLAVQGEQITATEEQIAVQGAEDAAIDATKVAETGLAEETGLLDAMMGGIPLIIGAIVTGLGVWAISAGHAATATDQTMQEVQQKLQETQSSFQQHGEEIQKLADQYSMLEKATNSGQTGDVQQQQEYYSVMQQLATLLPDVNEYTDANGQIHIKNAAAVQQEVTNLQHLNAAQADSLLLMSNEKKTVDGLYESFIKLAPEIYQLEQNIKNMDNGLVTVKNPKDVGYLGYESGQSQTMTVKTNPNSQENELQKQQWQDQLAVDQASEQEMLQQYRQYLIQRTEALVQANQKGLALTDQQKTLIEASINSIDPSQMLNAFKGGQDAMLKFDDTVGGSLLDVNKGLKQVSDQSGVTANNIKSFISTTMTGSGLKIFEEQLNGVADSMVKASTEASQNAMSLDTMAQKVDQAVTNNKTLYTAEQELYKQGHLNIDTLDAMIEAYPKFATVVGSGTDAQLTMIQALKNSSMAWIEHSKTVAEQNKQDAENTIKSIEAQITAAEALDAVLSAGGESAARRAHNLGIPYNDWNTSGLNSQLDAAKQKLQDAETQLNLISTWTDYATGNPDMTKAASTSTSKSTKQTDKYAAALDAVNAALDEQKAKLAGYDTASQQYRDGLQKEIDLLKQKEDLLKKDIAYNGGSASTISTSSSSHTTSHETTSGAYHGAYSSYINAAAQTYGVPAQLIAAEIIQESGFNPNAVSSAGAIGMMQLMPGTARMLGVSNPYNVQENIMGGTKYLAQLYREYGNWEDAIAGYYSGGGSFHRGQSIPSYDRSYVNSVMSHWRSLGGSSGGSYSGSSSEPLLRYGSRGSSVRTLQEALRKAGYHISVDGIFGSQTRATVEAYQRRHHLSVDGIVGNQTWGSLGYDKSGGGGSSSSSSGSVGNSTAVSDQKELTSAEQQIQQLYDEIAQSQITEFSNQSTEADNEATKYADILKNYVQGSAEYQNTIKEEIKYKQQKVDITQQEIDYINKELNSTTISDAEKGKLIQTQEKLNADIEGFKNDVSDLNYQLITSGLQSMADAVTNLDNQLKEAQKTMSLWTTDTAQYEQAYEQQIQLINQKAQALQQEEQAIRAAMSNSSLTDAQQQELQKQLDSVLQAEQSNSDDILTIRKDAADQIIKYEQDVINAQQNAESQRHQQVMQNLTDEKDAYDSLIQEKLKEIQTTQQQQKYTEQLSLDQQAAQKIQNQLNALALDNSAEGIAKKEQLQQQLADSQRKITDEQNQYSTQQQQQALQDQQKAFDDSIKAQQDAENTLDKTITEALKNSLSDTESWNQQVLDIMTGNFSDVQKQIQNLTNIASQNLGVLGQGVINSLLTNLASASFLLSQLNNLPNAGGSGTIIGVTGNTNSTTQQALDAKLQGLGIQNLDYLLNPTNSNGVVQLLQNASTVVQQALAGTPTANPNLVAGTTNNNQQITITIPVNIEQLTGDAAGAQTFVDTIDSLLKRKGVILP